MAGQYPWVTPVEGMLPPGLFVHILPLLVILGFVRCEDLVVYEYAHPDLYEERYAKRGDLREAASNNEVVSNEVQPMQMPSNFTTEEYTFTLFSWSHRYGTPISENCSIAELQNIVDPSLDTKIVVHGWLSSANSYIVNNTIKVYLGTRNMNAVAVDWSSLAGLKLYPVTTYSVAPVGHAVAKLVLRMLEAGVTTHEKMHLIGHSLGAHVMGVAGHQIHNSSGKLVSRISGLDPAAPMFEYAGGKNASRLDPSDAAFVDVIHTAGTTAGYYGTLGHVDFYPNGGTPVQPGCMDLSFNVIGCSHGMSYKYYDESISNPKGFRAVKCPNWNSFTNGSCSNNSIAYMGDPTPPSTRGIYYLTTNAEPPYAKG